MLGRNGAGKTTLLQACSASCRWPPASAGSAPARCSASCRRAPARSRARSDCSTASSPTSGLAAGEARSLLATFALGADDVLRPGRSLSPGERSRAAIALLAARGVNALVLDEPTNNLDLEAIEQLELALASYEGAAVLVSHDRRFLDAFGATQTLEL